MSDKQRALVVDDMERNRSAIKTFLFLCRFEVDTADDGLQAQELLKKNSYAVVFSDIEMPNMNGFELLGWIRKSSPASDVPVIMLSTLDSPEVIERCKRLGASAYIVKPFTNDKMKEALKSAGVKE